MIGDTNLRLPPGWALATLAEACLPVEKVAPESRPTERFTYVDIASIDNYSFRITQPKTYLGKDSPSRAKQRIATDDTLFSTVRTYLRNIALVPPQYDGQVASTGFCVLRPSEVVNPRFLFYSVQTDDFISALGSLQRGTSYPAVRVDDVLAQGILLPPLAEQDRIVAEIEKHFTRLDAAISSLQRAQANLKRYRASVLKAACEGCLVPTEVELARREGRAYEPATTLLERILKERRARWEERERHQGSYRVPQPPDSSTLPSVTEGWVWATLGQLCAVGTGSTPLTTKREYYDGGTIPWVTSGAVSSLQVTAAEKWVTERAVRDHRLRRYPAGTLIVAMYGEGHNRGKVSELLLDATINQALAALLFEGLSEHCRGYVKWFLLSRYEETRRAAVGGVQPNLNLSTVGRIPVPLPPLNEQHRINSEVERHLSDIQVTEDAVEANMKRAEQLRQAILRRAFEGKLVPQDPADEPASVLLERIRAEREQVGRNTAEARRRVSRRQKTELGRHACRTREGDDPWPQDGEDQAVRTKSPRF